MNQKDLLTPEQVAEELQINIHTIWNWLRQGKLKGKKMGRLWRIPRENLDEFLGVDETDYGAYSCKLNLHIDPDTVAIQSDEFGEMVTHLPDEIVQSLIKFFQKQASVEEPEFEDHRDFAAKVAYKMKQALIMRNNRREDVWPYIWCEAENEAARIAQGSDQPNNSGLCPICRRENCNWAIIEKFELEKEDGAIVDGDIVEYPTIKINNHSHHDNLGILVEGKFVEKVQEKREAWLKKNPDEWLEE